MDRIIKAMAWQSTETLRCQATGNPNTAVAQVTALLRGNLRAALYAAGVPRPGEGTTPRHIPPAEATQILLRLMNAAEA